MPHQTHTGTHRDPRSAASLAPGLAASPILWTGATLLLSTALCFAVALLVLPSVAQHEQMATPAAKTSAKSANPNRFTYWIELYRDGKISKCDANTTFKSGDVIRFHFVPDSDGYACLIGKGTSGKRTVLSPKPADDLNKLLKKGQDSRLPATTWLEFDHNTGTEEVSMIFSPHPLKIDPAKVHENGSGIRSEKIELIHR